MSITDSPLGQHTTYPSTYQPGVLFAIPRKEGRQVLSSPVALGVSQGCDYWHVFELSWRSAVHSRRECALGRLRFDAASPYIVESKSLKLYFNSLNFEFFPDSNSLIATVERDLSQVSGAPVQLEVFPVTGLLPGTWQGILLDELVPSNLASQPDPKQLQHQGTLIAEETLITHLFRSNCPVTSQPDWASIQLRYQGQQWDHLGVLAYLLSYEQHCGFHEQCVEQIFNDLWHTLQPQALMVQAAFTRRGGLDINPVRVSRLDWLPAPIRLARQ